MPPGSFVLPCLMSLSAWGDLPMAEASSVRDQPRASSSVMRVDQDLSMARTLRFSVGRCQRHSVTGIRFNAFMHLGERIRAERESQGITRAELARAAGIAPSTLSDLELGLSKGTTALHKIASHLRVSPEWLETGKASKPAALAVSQAERLNAVKVMSTTKALITFLKRRDPDAVLDLTDPDDAELFAAAYAEALALPPQPTDEETQIFGAVVSDLISKRGAKHERAGSKSAGGNTGEEVRARGSRKKA